MPPDIATPPRGRLELRVGICSERGGRARNEDFAAAWLGEPGRRGAIAALADGVGGAKGGRVAAELAVRGLIDGLLGQIRGARRPPHRRPGDRGAERLDPCARARPTRDLAGMGCTLTAVVLRGRRMHVLHVGDSRLYRFRDGVLARLTTDHAQPGANVLTRAIGAAEERAGRLRRSRGAAA